MPIAVPSDTIHLSAMAIWVGGLELWCETKRQEDLRADAARLAANPEYQAEIRTVREELDELHAW